MNLQAKWRQHATPDERTLVHVIDACIEQQTALRNVIVKRIQVRMRYRLKLATTDRRTK